MIEFSDRSADAVDIVSAKEIKQADARAAFKVQAKQITAGFEEAQDLIKSGRRAEGMAMLKQDNLDRMYGLVKRISADMSKVEQDRTRVDQAKIDPAKRTKWTAELDLREAFLLDKFNTLSREIRARR